VTATSQYDAPGGCLLAVPQHVIPEKVQAVPTCITLETDLFSFSRSIIAPLLRKHMPARDCSMTDSGLRQQHVHGMQALTFLLPEEEKEFRLVGGTLHF
jgi:hypothetical protein